MCSCLHRRSLPLLLLCISTTQQVPPLLFPMGINCCTAVPSQCLTPLAARVQPNPHASMKGVELSHLFFTHDEPSLSLSLSRVVTSALPKGTAVSTPTFPSDVSEEARPSLQPAASCSLSSSGSDGTKRCRRPSGLPGLCLVLGRVRLSDIKNAAGIQRGARP